MAAQPVSTTPLARARRAVGSDLSFGGVLVAAAVPLLFLHADFEPTASLAIGTTNVDVTAADAAVAVVLVAALVAARRHGWARLRAGRVLWILAALLACWTAFEALRPLAFDDAERDAHLVTLLKAYEYALLAPAVVLLCREAEHLAMLLVALSVWCAAAAVVAAAQFFGLDVFHAWRAGWRQPSFLGHHDLAALACLVLAAASAFVLARRTLVPRLLVLGAPAAALVALVLSGSTVAAAGFACAAVVVAVPARRRLAAPWRRIAVVAAAAGVALVGVLALRADPLADFMRFVGVRHERPAEGIESYSQRTVLAYFGIRIFADRPLLGAGWQRSDEPAVFGPYVDDARRRFPDVVAEAFPSAARRWGVQNAYVQSLAELGVVGLLLLGAVFAAGTALAWRAVERADDPWTVAALAALAALVALAAIWAAVGLVPGIPLQVATSLALGLAAACAAARESRA